MQKLLGPTDAQSLVFSRETRTSGPTYDTEKNPGKIFSREDIFAWTEYSRKYLLRKIYQIHFSRKFPPVKITCYTVNESCISGKGKLWEVRHRIAGSFVWNDLTVSKVSYVSKTMIYVFLWLKSPFVWFFITGKQYCCHNVLNHHHWVSRIYLPYHHEVQWIIHAVLVLI